MIENLNELSKFIFTFGCMIGPPALNAYAVLPLGVQINIPSPIVVVNSLFYKYISKIVQL